MKGIFSLLHQTPTSLRLVTGVCVRMSGLARSAVMGYRVLQRLWGREGAGWAAPDGNGVLGAKRC